MGLLKRFLLLFFLCGFGFVGWLGWFASTPIPLASSPLDFSIPVGASLRGAAQQMAASGLGFSPWQFELLGRLGGKATEIKAGSYEASEGITPWQLLMKLSRGDVTQSEIVLVEGKTFRQFRAALDGSPDLRHDTAGLRDQDIMARLGATERSPEGLFFPDTYLFAKQSSDLEVLGRAYRNLRARLDSEWQARDPALPYGSAYEGLIMASIVEKETGQPADRPEVAAVFVNRLRQGMLLQTDPTVIYGMGERFNGNIRKQDLTADTPYNTYIRTGLPPTPIAMPGLASLRAAFHPAASQMLYFVSRGDGSSKFSRTLEEHNRAVANYRKRQGG